jgi:PAS domain-containing protein
MSKEQILLNKSLQEDLENLERYIQEYSLFLPLAIYSINPIGIIVDVNHAGKELAKFEEIELIGKEINFLFKENKKTINFLQNEGANHLERRCICYVVSFFKSFK